MRHSTRPVSLLRDCLLSCLAAASSHAAALLWQPPPDKLTVLAVCAHPDDEGIFFGGALPYYAAVLQVPTVLVAMTSGDWSPANLTVREAELRQAAWTYGLRHEPLFPRFRDVPSHSLANNPYPNRIDATWDYWADGILQGDGSDVAAGRARAVHYVAEQIRRFRPEVVFTHDLNGEYGHDNHKATAQAVIEGVAVAADPAAAATNLAGLAPWQIKKLYVHLLATNRLFHTHWETAYDELGGLTPRQAADAGLNAHVSQSSPDVSTFYRTGENFDGYDSEWWGLAASTVGTDTPGPDGPAVGNFLENLALDDGVNDPPAFLAAAFELPAAFPGQPYTGVTLARYATDPDKVAGDVLAFTKVSGPAWLNVATNGLLTGLPGLADQGTNVFVLRVADVAGASEEATVSLRVLGSLAALWDCDAGAGVSLADGSDGGHDAALTNGATWGEGRRGSALALDGTDDHATAPNLALGGELTIAAWIRPSLLTGDRAIVGESGAYTFKTAGTSLRFTTPGVRDHTFAAVLNVGVWQHVTVTFQAGATGGCKFYLNGQLLGAVNASAKNSTANPTWLGRNQFGQYWAGRLDDVRVHRTVLTGAEIQSLFANQPPAYTANPLFLPPAAAQRPYGQTLAGTATDPDAGDTLSFRKQTGPAWLSVAAGGALAGTPGHANVGTNVFTVSVTDRWGAAATAQVAVVVAYEPTHRLTLTRTGPPLQLEFHGEAGRDYQLLRSTNLVAWEVIATQPADGLGQATFTDAAPASPAFYRARSASAAVGGPADP